MSQIDPGAIQERIRQARREAGLTQQDLADLIDRHKRTVENYENTRVPSWAELSKIARVLNRPVEWFLHGEDGDVSTDPAQLEAVLARVEELHQEVRAVRGLVESLLEDRPPATPDTPRVRQGG